MKERIKINKDAIFIDTSGFIAAIREDDQFFRIASAYFNDMDKHFRVGGFYLIPEGI